MKKDTNTIVWFIYKFNKYQFSVHAAQVTFFIMLSFFPFMMFLLSIFKYTSIDQTILETLIYELVPGNLSHVVSNWVKESYLASGTILSITAISTLWAGSKGFNSISYELDAIYEIKNRRNFIFRRLHSILDTILFSTIIIISLVLLVYGNQIIQVILRFLPPIQDLGIFLFLARSSLSLFLFVTYFTCMYTFVPKRHGRLREEIPGAIFSSFLWIGFSYLYSIYVDTKYIRVSIYGSLTSIVLLMLWLYFCIIFIFLGALLNQYLRHHKLNLIHSLKEIPKELRLFLKNKS